MTHPATDWRQQSTAEHILRVVSDSLDSTFGADWHLRNDSALGDASFFADVLAERLHASGLHACIACNRLTDAEWGDAPMCSPCQDRNPAIQQMKAAGL